jgi:hypothetical protein
VEVVVDTPRSLEMRVLHIGEEAVGQSQLPCRDRKSVICKMNNKQASEVQEWSYPSWRKISRAWLDAEKDRVWLDDVFTGCVINRAVYHFTFLTDGVRDILDEEVRMFPHWDNSQTLLVF